MRGRGLKAVPKENRRCVPGKKVIRMAKKVIRMAKRTAKGTKLGKKLIRAANEGAALARGASAYASKRVFSGTRPVSGARTRKLQAAKPVVQSERCLHMHCQQWLVKSGWWDKLLIFHVPNERRGGIGTVLHFKRLGVRPGVADYLVFGCRDAAIELKDYEGEQSEDQKKFQRRWEAAGKLYFVVRELESFQGTIIGLSMFC